MDPQGIRKEGEQNESHDMLLSSRLGEMYSGKP